MSLPYSPPALDPHQKAAAESGDLEFLLPYQKALYRTGEVAGTIDREEKFVRSLIEAGRLEAFRDSAVGTHKSSRVTRRSLVLYLSATANFEPADLVRQIEKEILPTLRPHHLQRLIATATKQLNAL